MRIGLSAAVLSLVALAESGVAASGAEPIHSFATGGHGVYHLQPATIRTSGERGVIAAAFDGTVLCYTAAGERIWAAQPSADFPYDLCVANLDRDDLSEAIVATAGGELHALDHDGRLLWRFRDPAPLFQVAVARGADGAPVVLAGGVSQKLYALSAAGELRGAVPVEHCIRHLRAGDFRGEGRDLIAMATTNAGLSGLLSLALVDPANLEVVWRQRDLGTHAFNSGKRFFSLAAADLNADGRAEMILSNSWGEYGKIFAWDGSGKKVFETSDRRIDRIPYRMNLLTSVVLPEDRFILGLFGNELIVYNLDGSCREVLKGPYSCANAAFDPVTRTYYLGSSVSGGDEIHALRLDDPGWKQAFTALPAVGRLARIEAGLARLRAQVAAFAPPDYQPAPRRVTALADQPDGRRYEHLAFVKKFIWSQRITSRDELWCRAIDRRRDYDMTADEIEAQALTLEREGQHFLVWAGHGHAVHFPLGTFERIVAAAPKHLWGFEFAEMEGIDPEMQEVVEKILLPLAELCRRHGKKIVFRNKNIYWNGSCYVPFLKRVLLDARFRDVFVPALEETNCRTQELSLAGRVGLWQTGSFDQWSCRMVTDNANWDRMWEWGGQQVPVHHLRHLVSRAALGAEVFFNDVHQGPFTERVYAQLTPFYDMLEKGILQIPRREDLLSLSEVAIGMRSPPDAEFLRHGINGHRYRFPEDTHEPMVFDRLDGYWGGAPLAAHDAARLVYGVTRRQLNFLAPMPFGLVPIVPAETPAGPGRMFRHVLQTDGRFWYDEHERQVSAAAYLDTVGRALETAAEKLTVRVSGDVHWSAVRLDATHIRVLLVDPGYLDPDDREARVTLQRGELVNAVDILSREPLARSGGVVELRVPAGLFRVIDLTTAAQPGNGGAVGRAGAEGRLVLDPATGAFIAEVESAVPVSDWKLETEQPGFTGNGYLAWRGPHVKKHPGTAVLRFRVEIAAPGRYALSIRARRDQEGAKRPNDRVNDVFVRLDGQGKWTKVSHKTPWGQWGWMRKFSFSHGLEDAVFELTPGEHVLEIAARSDNVKIDSLRLEREAVNR